jgi:hypothetical protein
LISFQWFDKAPNCDVFAGQHEPIHQNILTSNGSSHFSSHSSSHGESGMLRFLFQVLSHLKQRPTSSDVVLHAHIEATPESVHSKPTTIAAPHAEPARQLKPAPPGVTHRQRLLSMQLEHTKLCSPHRAQRLKSLGVFSAGDLSNSDLKQLAAHFSASKKALRMLTQYRRAIRFAAAVPGMMPRDAMLLISIHRRSVRGLACESAAALHRDLERFAESTQGRIQLRGRRIPSTRRLKQWITTCEEGIPRQPMQGRAA